jgi:hypothetical protein
MRLKESIHQESLEVFTPSELLLIDSRSNIITNLFEGDILAASTAVRGTADQNMISLIDVSARIAGKIEQQLGAEEEKTFEKQVIELVVDSLNIVFDLSIFTYQNIVSFVTTEKREFYFHVTIDIAKLVEKFDCIKQKVINFQYYKGYNTELWLENNKPQSVLIPVQLFFVDNKMPDENEYMKQIESHEASHLIDNLLGNRLTGTIFEKVIQTGLPEAQQTALIIGDFIDQTVRGETWAYIKSGAILSPEEFNDKYLITVQNLLVELGLIIDHETDIVAPENLNIYRSGTSGEEVWKKAQHNIKEYWRKIALLVECYEEKYQRPSSDLYYIFRFETNFWTTQSYGLNPINRLSPRFKKLLALAEQSV